MRKAYGESYSPLLFLIGSGEAMAYDEHYNRKDNWLSSPPENSMEYFLSLIDDKIYKNTGYEILYIIGIGSFFSAILFGCALYA